MARRFNVYETRTGHNLGDPAHWNSRFEDVDIRFHALETNYGQIEQVAQEVLALGLQRLNDDLTPIIEEAYARLTSTSEVFEGDSATAVEIGTGTKNFTIIEEHRASWLRLQYVAAVRAGDPAEFMYGTVTSYNPTTGALVVNVTLAEGSGTHNDWAIISSGPRGLIGPQGEPAAASLTPFTPVDGISADDVQAAIEFVKNLVDDLDSGLAAVEGDLSALEGQVDTIDDDLNALETAALLKSVEDQTITGGAAVTLKDLGTWTTGTLTPDPGDCPMQKVTANGAFTLAASSVNGSTVLRVTNGASAGTITFSGFTDGGGDAYVTTNTAVFLITIIIAEAGGKYYQIRRLS